MSLLRQKAPLTRDKRQKALNAFYDGAGVLKKEYEEDEVRQRVRTFAQDTLNDIIYALRAVNSIYNSAVIIHGPRGCAASQASLELKTGFKGRWAVTNINEKDSILGSEQKLKEAVTALYKRYKPEVIFILTTPVVAINNDDVQAAAEELRESLGIEIVPVYTDGFKSKVGATGLDIINHALVRYFYKKAQPGGKNSVNIISVTEGRADIDELVRLTEELGVKAYVLPQEAGSDSLGSEFKVRPTVSVNPDEGEYLGNVLEEKFGVPFIRPPLPVGVEGTSEWILALGKHLGIEKEAAALVEREVSVLKKSLKDISLSGVNIYLNLPPAYAFGIWALLEELGASVAGVTVPFFQNTHVQNLEAILKKGKELNLHIAEGQTFEELNILKRLRPDLYIGWAGQHASCSGLGIPCLVLGGDGVLGYSGSYILVKRILKTLKNQAFFKRFSVEEKPVYQAGWYLKKPNWYIKQEVK